MIQPIELKDCKFSVHHFDLYQDETNIFIDMPITIFLQEVPFKTIPPGCGHDYYSNKEGFLYVACDGVGRFSWRERESAKWEMKNDKLRWEADFDFRSRTFITGNGNEFEFHNLGSKILKALEQKPPLEVIESFYLLSEYAHRFIAWVNKHNRVYGHLYENYKEKNRMWLALSPEERENYLNQEY